MAATKKKVLGIVLVAVLLFAVPAVFAACAEKEEKYDVAIKLANSLGQEWIFSPILTNCITSASIRGRK